MFFIQLDACKPPHYIDIGTCSAAQVMNSIAPSCHQLIHGLVHERTR